MAYTVVRTDRMSGTKDEADLVSVRVYDAQGKQIAVENGTMVVLGQLESGNREVYKATLATADSTTDKCVLIATPEVPYDERIKNLDGYINEAGKICRGYMLRRGNIFSVTKEGFVNGTAPTANATVAFGANGKIAATGTSLGTVKEIEVGNRYTYYAIEIK